MSAYRLPSHPDVTCTDPISVISEDADTKPAWAVLHHLLSGPCPADIDSFIQLLSTVSYSLYERDIKLTGLQEFLKARPAHVNDKFMQQVLPAALKLAARLPVLFPSGELPVLSPTSPSLMLSRDQVACLVVHLMLCSLAAPACAQAWWEGGFACWYATCSSTTTAYLTSLFTYLQNTLLTLPTDSRSSNDTDSSPDPINVTFYLSHVPTDSQVDWLASTETIQPVIALCEEAVQQALSAASAALDNETSGIQHLNDEALQGMRLLGCCGAAQLVFSNSNVGFGPAGTQEEQVMGASPPLCLAPLVCSTLRPNEAALVLGAPVVGRITGYGRQTTWAGPLLPPSRDSHAVHVWHNRVVLLADAEELDTETAESGKGMLDLKPAHVSRELCKLYAAFSACQQLKQGITETTHVTTGHWGCGAFGGHPQVKALLQLLVASHLGLKLLFLDVGPTANAPIPLGAQLEDLSRSLASRGVTVGTFATALKDCAEEYTGAQGQNLFQLLEERCQ